MPRMSRCSSCHRVPPSRPALAEQPSPRLAFLQSSDQLSEQDKKLYVQKRLLESYQTDDPATKIPLLREILSIDPMNPFAREDLTKAEVELEQKLLESRN